MERRRCAVGTAFSEKHGACVWRKDAECKRYGILYGTLEVMLTVIGVRKDSFLGLQSPDC